MDSMDREVPERQLEMPVLLFDGSCGFCTALVHWLDPRLERRTRLLPWQAADLQALSLTEDEARRSVWWIEPGGPRFHSEAAVAQALIACRGIWRRIGLALQAPGIRTLAAVCYRLVARMRHRLPGTAPACGEGEGRVGSPSRGPG